MLPFRAAADAVVGAELFSTVEATKSTVPGMRTPNKASNSCQASVASYATIRSQLF